MAVVISGCSSTAPTPPTILTIGCPAPPPTPLSTGDPIAIGYDAPVVVGGIAPVTTTCTPPSGSNFPVGTTDVTCTAHDAKQQAASCSFSITVSKTPTLAASRLVAFGDSITEGVTATCIRTTQFMTFAETMLVLPKAANDPWAYPNVLQARLRERYVTQSPSVANRGSAGEELSAGITRLPGVLTAETPQVLLLQEGANDVNQGRSPASIGNSLRTMVREGRGRGLQVYLGTLLPQRPVGVQGSCRGFGADGVAAANDQIRSVAAGEGAVLVDLFQAFGGIPGDLIGPDGLHPSEAGYRKIADAFFEAIQQRLEN